MECINLYEFYVHKFWYLFNRHYCWFIYSRKFCLSKRDAHIVILMILAPGLFTGRDCCSDKEAAHEAVVNYCKWAAMKSMW